METRLKQGDIIFMHYGMDDLKKGKKYKVNKVFHDRNGNPIYQLRNNRKDAVTNINIYADWIDCELNEKTTSQVENPLEFVFAKSIFIVK